MAINSKEQKRSIILCADKDFRIRSVNTLIDCALAGDKFQFERLVEAREKFLVDDKIEIFVVNGAEYQSSDLIGHLAVFDDLHKQRPRTKFIIFISKEQKDEVMAQAKAHPNCHFFLGQVNKRDLNSVINPIRTTQTSAFNSPIVSTAPVHHEPVKKSAELNQAFMEASSHVRDTVQALGELSKNRSNLVSLHKIGQRFNGFVGTFAFVEGRDGYTQLMQLATIIDEITRHYSATELPEITEKHFNLLLEAAKCSYLMLKELRENKLPKDEQMAQYLNIITEYGSFTEIKRLTKVNQEEVDQLLKAL